MSLFDFSVLWESLSRCHSRACVYRRGMRIEKWWIVTANRLLTLAAHPQVRVGKADHPCWCLGKGGGDHSCVICVSVRRLESKCTVQACTHTHKHIIPSACPTWHLVCVLDKFGLCMCVVWHGVCVCVQTRPCGSESAVAKQLTLLSDRLTDFHKLIWLWGRRQKTLMKLFTSGHWKSAAAAAATAAS